MVRRALWSAFWTFTQTVALVIDRVEIPMSPDERTRLLSYDNTSSTRPRQATHRAADFLQFLNEVRHAPGDLGAGDSHLFDRPANGSHSASVAEATGVSLRPTR
jgi:hypothetical protein